jgi:hypothetical protein
MAALDIIGNENENAIAQLQTIKRDTSGKMRLIELNKYYSQRYGDHTQIMKMIIWTLVPLLLLTILKNMGYLPPTLYAVIATIIAVIAVYYVGYHIVMTMNRDKLNYDEFDWYFDQKQAPAINTEVKGGNPWKTVTNGAGGSCTGAACCSSDQTYDDTLDLCITPSQGTATGDSGRQNYGISSALSSLYSGTQSAAQSATYGARSFVNNADAAVSSVVPRVFGFRNMSDNGHISGASESVFSGDMYARV